MSNLNYIDIAIIGIIGLSTIIAFFRGLITEALSLLVWIIAFWGAAYFSQDVASMLPGQLNSLSGGKIDLVATEGSTEELLVSILSYAITFLGILFLAGLVNLAISLMIRFLKISFIDRFLGMFFGLLRGWLVVAFLGLFAMNAGLNSIPMWQKAQLAPFVETSANMISKFLPTKFLQQINISELSKLLQSDLQTPQAQPQSAPVQQQAPAAPQPVEQ